MKFKLKSMPLAIVQVIASGALSAIAIHPAMAQQSAEAPQRVVVTGSMISRADKETPSPVQILSADDLAKTGMTSVAEVLSNLTANGQGALNQGFSGAFAGGASGAALRGLTVGATLVLIDGHRMAPYPLGDDAQRSFVDISSIPFDAVDRIEVLKDGASSVYGSDAIAGVINVILKKTFKGTSVKSDVGTSQHGGGRTTHVAVTHGMGDLAADGYNVFGSAEYRKSEAIMLSDRDSQQWANGNWTSRGGIDLRPGVPNAVNAFRVATNTPFFYDQTGTGGANNAANFTFATSACDYTKYRAGDCNVRDTKSYVKPPTENLNLLFGVTKNLSDDWKLVVKGSMFESKDQNNRGLPLTFSAGSFAGNTALVPGSAPAQVNVIPSFLVPATYPGNPYGKAVRIYGYIPDVAPQRSAKYDTKSYRLAADLTGTVAGWDVNASLGHTKVETHIDYSGYINRVALYNALIRTSDPFKVTGGNSAADMAAIAPGFSNTVTDQLDFAELRGGRELAQLSGGPLGVSVGTTIARKKLNTPPPSLLANGTVGSGAAYASGTETNTAAFFEFNAPVLKNLEIDASGRLDHFDTYGNSQTPKVGFKFAPSNMLTFRGTFSKGFRAPNPAENGTAGALFSFNAVNDPILCPDGKTTTKGNVISACGFTPAFVQLTSKDLKPEKSKSTTFGLILEPVKGWSTTLDYYKIVVDNQIVTASGLPDFVPSFVRGEPLPTAISDGTATGSTIGMPSVGQVIYATSGYVNAGSTSTAGIELDTNYKFRLGDMGTLKADFTFNHMTSYIIEQGGVSYQLAGTHGPSIVSGDTGNPKNRAQATFGWDQGPLNVATTVNWVGDFSALDPTVGGNNCNNVNRDVAGRNYFPANSTPLGYCTIHSFTTVDLTVTYKLGKQWTFHGSVQNLLDRAPPTDVATYGNAGGLTSYNASLHQAGAIGRFFNVGVNYNF